MIIKTLVLIKYKDYITEQTYDCMEIYTKLVPNAVFIEEGDCVVESKHGDNNLGTFYTIDGRNSFFHMLGGTRNKNGLDHYTKEEYDILLAYWKKHFWLDVAFIIPTYGPVDFSIYRVIDKFKEMSVDNIYIVSGDNHIADEGIDTCPILLSKTSSSKAYLINHAVSLIGAQRYVIHDRDIMPIEEVVMWAYVNEYKFSLNHGGVWYHNMTSLEKTAPGGSVTFDWDVFMIAGGMDHHMEGVGLEDREFNNRMKFVTGKIPNLQCELVHIDHPRRLMYDDYKKDMLKRVHSGRVEMEKDGRHIWEFIKSEL